MDLRKKRRFNSRVNNYMFDSVIDFMGKGEQGTVLRAYEYGNLASKPVALKIVRKSNLTGKFKKWMYREIAVHQELS